MLDILKTVGENLCVNGSEYHFARFLKSYFEKKGYCVSIDPLNNVLVQKDHSSLPPKAVIFTPMDCPGYLTLYLEEDEVYLTPSAKITKDLKTVTSVCDTENKIYKLYESKYDKDAYYIKKSDAHLGESFLPSFTTNVSENQIKGRFSARISCISSLIKLAESVNRCDVAFCFTAGFHSEMKSEACIANRIQAENSILLGFAESDDNKAILCVKDGKHFSSQQLSHFLLLVCQDQNLPIKPIVFDKVITGAERLHSPFTKNTISLALPCEKIHTEEETVSIKAMQEIIAIISSFLEQIVF